MASTPATTSRLALRALPLLALAAGACGEAPLYLPPSQAGSPAGALSGDLTYAGPLPCTQGQHVVGAAVLLFFDVKLLPPPEGLGTTAASLAAVGGDELFAGVADRLTFNKDGSLWCPAAGTAPVTVGSSWAVAPLDGGVYEVRGFYDYDGNFDPTLSIQKLPTKGDVAGGAIDNAAAVLQGAAPVYRRIALGAEQADGTFKIPPEGSLIGGVAVTLGLPLPLNLPVFNVTGVSYSPVSCNGDPPLKSDATHATMPSDYMLPVFNQFLPDKTEPSLVRIKLTSGLPVAEQTAGAASPFGLPVKPADKFTFSWQDVNGDGTLSIDGDHVPDSTLIPSLFPLAIFAKLVDDPKNTNLQRDLQAQAAPVVILQGLTIYQSLSTTATTPLCEGQATSCTPAKQLELQDENLLVGVRPAVLCLDPSDPLKGGDACTTPSDCKTGYFCNGEGRCHKHATLLVTHETDCDPAMNKLLSDEAGTKNALKKQFGQDVDIVYGCLPQGRYAINLVYGTGQAWTVPNEAGVCAANEPTSKDGTHCTAPPFTRPLLPSQDVVLTIGPPVHPEYCAAHPVPAECLPPPAKK